MSDKKSNQQSLQSKNKDRKKVKHYQELYYLGLNNLSQTFRAKNLKNEKKCLLKSFSKSQFPNHTHLRSKLEAEIGFLRKNNNLNHIIKVLDLTMTKHNYYVICDNYEDWTLLNYVRNNHIFTELQAGYFLMQIIQGYNEYRENGVTCRDMSMNNILKHKDKIIIDDLGFSKYIDYQVLRTQDRIYKLSEAPEAYQGQYKSDKSDVWSIGIIFYQMIYGIPPFESQDHQELLSKALHQKLFFFDHINGISAQCKDLLKKMLVVNPQNRIDWHSIFKHPFFKELEKRLDLQRQKQNMSVSNIQQLLKLDMSQNPTQIYLQSHLNLIQQEINSRNITIDHSLNETQQYQELRKSYVKSVRQSQISQHSFPSQSQASQRHIKVNGKQITKVKDIDSLNQSLEKSFQQLQFQQKSNDQLKNQQQQNQYQNNARYQVEQQYMEQEYFSNNSSQNSMNTLAQKKILDKMQFTFQAQSPGQKLVSKQQLQESLENSLQKIQKIIDNSNEREKSDQQYDTNSQPSDFNTHDTNNYQSVRSNSTNNNNNNNNNNLENYESQQNTNNNNLKIFNNKMGDHRKLSSSRNSHNNSFSSRDRAVYNLNASNPQQQQQQQQTQQYQNYSQNIVSDESGFMAPQSNINLKKNSFSSNLPPSYKDTSKLEKVMNFKYDDDNDNDSYLIRNNNNNNRKQSQDDYNCSYNFSNSDLSQLHQPDSHNRLQNQPDTTKSINQTQENKQQNGFTSPNKPKENQQYENNNNNGLSLQKSDQSSRSKQTYKEDEHLDSNNDSDVYIPQFNTQNRVKRQSSTSPISSEQQLQQQQPPKSQQQQQIQKEEEEEEQKQTQQDLQDEEDEGDEYEDDFDDDIDDHLESDRNTVKQEDYTVKTNEQTHIPQQQESDQQEQSEEDIEKAIQKASQKFKLQQQSQVSQQKSTDFQNNLTDLNQLPQTQSINSPSFLKQKAQNSEKSQQKSQKESSLQMINSNTEDSDLSNQKQQQQQYNKSQYNDIMKASQLMFDQQQSMTQQKKMEQSQLQKSQMMQNQSLSQSQNQNQNQNQKRDKIKSQPSNHIPDVFDEDLEEICLDNESSCKNSPEKAKNQAQNPEKSPSQEQQITEEAAQEEEDHLKTDTKEEEIEEIGTGKIQQDQEGGEFGNITSVIQSQIQKYSILGDALIQAEKLLKALGNKGIFACFFLYKTMFLTRAVLEDEFTTSDQFAQNFKNWDQFTESQEYQELIDKFVQENNDIFVNLKHIQQTARNYLKNVTKSQERNYLEPHLEIDMSDDFKEVYFVYVMKLLNEAYAAYKNELKSPFKEESQCELLKLQAQLLDCIIINEIDLLEDDDDLFQLKEYQEIQVGGSVKNSKFISKYIKRKEETIMHYVHQYPGSQARIDQE